ncbi:MAG TPA: transposase [Longimicrobiales bacterium]|nr:transposase [Longimicrobiales bacterium]
MARPPRPNVPGHAFHLTTRLQDRAHRFTGPIRDRVLHAIARNVARSDIRLLAFVVMTNHLHLVVIQGTRSLGRFMQPLLTSIALLVRGAHGLEGHVFERRFHHTACRDLDHLRNAIAYTHANPVRAGLCEHPRDYRWSSHALYESGARRRRRGAAVAVDVATGLTAFTAHGPATRDPRGSYLLFLESFLCAPPWEPDSPAVPSERSRQAEATVARDDDGLHGSGCPARPALDCIAAEVLDYRGAPTFDEVTSRWGSRARFDARTRIAFNASRAGYTGREIATFLKVTEGAVSRMLRRTMSGPVP